MDRRQRKTRDAIFSAFTSLLSKKSFDKISVGEIIEIADIGRATFYSHFETKDYLLKELCSELFDHIFESDIGDEKAHSHIFDCNAPSSVFLHLFEHLEKNDNYIIQLLACENNDLFLNYFKNGVKELVKKHIKDFEDKKPSILPEDFWINYISSTFIETVRWWIKNGIKETPEIITKYILMII